VSGRETKALAPKGRPVVTFNDSATFHLNGRTVVVFHVRNAHTDGDAIVWFPEANVIHTGDCLFNGRYPVLDAGAGGTLDGMIAASERIVAMANADTKLIPGHGPLAKRADVEAFRDMLKETRSRLAPLIAQKKTLKEIQDLKPLASLDAKWGADSTRSAGFVAAAVAGMPAAK
jgi:glyoxylase-like metal-dependent hydrolase (beta-lactamase superfamily II)